MHVVELGAGVQDGHVHWPMECCIATLQNVLRGLVFPSSTRIKLSDRNERPYAQHWTGPTCIFQLWILRAWVFPRLWTPLSLCTSQVPPIFSDTPRSHLSQPPNVTNEYERLRLQQESCNSQMKDIAERLVTMESHLKEIANSVHPPEPQHATSSAGRGRIPPVISVSHDV